MNNRWLPVVTLLLIVANIVTLVLLWTSKKDSHGEMMPPPHPQVFEFLSKELHLNEQQQAAYRKLRDKHQADQNQLHDSIRISKDAMFNLLKQRDVSDSLLSDYAGRASKFDQQIDMITFKHFQQVRALCNEKQQQKFDEIIKEALHTMAGPGPHPPPPN